jgi:hypothetical protein
MLWHEKSATKKFSLRVALEAFVHLIHFRLRINMSKRRMAAMSE